MAQARSPLPSKIRYNNKERYVMRLGIRVSMWLTAVVITQAAFAQTNRIRYNNQNLFLSGANLAWVNFASDIGPGAIDTNRIADILLSMHDHGGNALRWWLHTNGTVTPKFDDSGFVIGPGNGTIEDMKKVLDLAWEREIGLKLCLWSFDMLRSANTAAVLNRNKLLLNDTNYTRAYINKCLIPMIDSLKGHPAIVAWEIFNEPEGMSNEFGWGDIQHVPMSSIQRFINLCTGAIHRTDTTAKVTSGAWSFLALTDVQTTSLPKAGSGLSQLTGAEKEQIGAQFRQKYRSSLSNDEIMQYLSRIAIATNYNYYADSRLISAGGDPGGTLDFYSVHYYSGIVPLNPTSISPFHHPKSYWSLDKPLVVAEFALQNIGSVPKGKLYDTVYQTGYAGALAWSWTDVNLSSPADMLTSMQFMWDNHKEDVDINGIGGDWPTVTITSPVTDTTFADSAEVTIVAAASDKDGSVISVQFFVSDTLKIGAVTAAPYTIVWKNMKSGLYTLKAVATDNQEHQRTSDRVPIRIGKPTTVRLEAEQAVRQGSGMTVRSDVTASGGAFLDMATQSGTVAWKLPNVPADGNYGITFGFKLFYDHPKSQYVNVNGVRTDTVVFDATSTSSWLEKSINVNLTKGENTVQMELSWGWMYLDYLAVPSIFVAVSVKNSSEAPDVYSLDQNYPNPFNPTTTIRFSLAKASNVKLTVHNILGQKIATLVDGTMSPGPQSIVFDASRFSSGVYSYRLEAGSFTKVAKMMLIK